MDVDGVLTDGILQWSQSGLTSLNFNVKDGSAIKSISSMGYHVVVCRIPSEIIKNRLNYLNIKNVFTGIDNKYEFMQKFVSSNGFDFKEVMHVADDRNDLELMKAAGDSVCPCDAISEIKAVSDIILQIKGGSGVCVGIHDLLSSKAN